MKILRLIPALLLLVLISCESGQFNQDLLNRTIRFRGSVENQNTRLANDKWEKGDAIGIYMKESGRSFTGSTLIASNVRYVTEGDGAFAPAKHAEELRYPLDNKKVDFVAVHPYKSVNAAYEYAINIENQENQTTLDLMLADNATNMGSSDKDVSLNFERMMAKIVVNLSSTGGLESNPRVNIKGINRKGVFSLTDNTISQSSKGDIRMKMNKSTGVAEAIVMPAASVDHIDMEIIHGTKGYNFSLSDAVNIRELSAGYKYELNISLDVKPEGYEVNVSANVNKWKDGASEDVSLDQGFEAEPEPEEGSVGNPYTIEQARNKEGEKNVWVEGYIVGCYIGTNYKSFVNEDEIENVDWDKLKDTNIALAPSPYETEAENTFPVQLPPNEIRDNLNVRDRPSNLGRKIIIYGNIETYFGLIGMKNVKDFQYRN